MPLSRRTVGTIAVYLGTCMATIAISIVTVALPAIQRDLEVDVTGLQWIVGSYGLCLSAFMLSAGPLGDRYGRKRVWLIGVAIFALGSALAAGASTLPMLIAGCAIQGVAGALVIPGALSILSQTYHDPGQLSRVIGGWASVSAVSLILGPFVGGIFIDLFGWFSVFLLNVPLGFAALILGSIGVSESADPDHTALDPAGQLLSITLLASLTFALTEAGRSGWDTPLVLAGFFTSGVSFLLFLVVEARAAQPVFPVDLFSDLTFASVNIASFVLGFMGYSSLFFFSLFLQNAQGVSASQAGLRMAPVFLSMAVFSFRFGMISSRFGMIRPMIGGYAAMGVAMLGMTTFEPDTSYALLFAMFLLLGAGMGLSVPATSAVIMAITPRTRTGASSATLNTMRQSGMTIGIALLGSLMAGASSRAIAMGDSMAEAAAKGFNAAVLWGGMSALAVSFLLITGTRRQDSACND
ncbi:MFS transporter [Tsuneonella flava]|uniref:MFS transporter n=2 Tax=Tsuneonella flava TaxID=2055955 RepID=A0ABX7KDD6_9SPHN|nr:MFS transporter [Tsuneonella flava]QSB45176.1 MFS transporter [Tsuneonella flava]